MRPCCPIRGVKIVRVGNMQVGLTGLDRVFDSRCSEGWSPEAEGVMDRVVTGLREAGNYITPESETDYETGPS